VIIWLNGTFGVGKTSTADRLAALVPGGRVFDPETVGTMLRANLADRPAADFQDWPAWPPLVAAAIAEISQMTGEHVIVPQTVLKRERLEQILVPLRAGGLEVVQVLLDADEAVLRSRVQGADEASSWRLDHLDEYCTARAWMAEMADLVVDTVATTPAQIARRILAGLPQLEKAEAPKARPASPVVPRTTPSAGKTAQGDKNGQADKGAQAGKVAGRTALADT
jgi:predicted kinase